MIEVVVLGSVVGVVVFLGLRSIVRRRSGGCCGASDKNCAGPCQGCGEDDHESSRSNPP